jgi:NADPH:quinone reductase-like Zn-dependent oxidoreductase
VIDARHGDLAQHVREATDGKGADAVIDIVGNRQSLEAGIKSLAIGGRLVIIGAKPKSVYKDDPSFMLDPGDFLHRGLELHSSRYVTAAEIAQTLELVRQRRITPVITRTFPLEKVEDAHELIRQNATAGRIALLMQD